MRPWAYRDSFILLAPTAQLGLAHGQVGSGDADLAVAMLISRWPLVLGALAAASAPRPAALGRKD